MKARALALPVADGSQGSARRARLIGWAGLLLIGFGLLMVAFAQQKLVAIRSDFSQDYLAALALRTGQSIYTESLHNYHPPFNAVLFLPLTLLPQSVAVVLWSVMSVALYLLIGRIVLRELKIALDAHWLLLLAGLALWWYPFHAHIALAQLSLLLTACVLIGWVLLRRGRDGLAGGLIGMACLIKLFPGLLVVYLLLRRRWVAAVAAIGTITVGYAVTFAVVGLHDFVRYHREIAPLDVVHFGGMPMNASLTGAINKLLVDGPWVQPLVVAPQAAAIAAALSSIAALLWFARRAWRLPWGVQHEDIGLGLGCVMMLLISPISWQHGFPLLALPFGLLLADQRACFDRGRAALALLALGLVSLPDVELAHRLMAAFAPNRLPWIASLPFYCSTLGLLMVAWLTHVRRAPGSPAPGVTPPASTVNMTDRRW